jgi:hypothetical protein
MDVGKEVVLGTMTSNSVWSYLINNYNIISEKSH